MTEQSGTDAATTIELPPRLDVGSCKALRDSVEEARDTPIALNAAGVEFVGGAGVELLLSAQAEWQAKGLDFQLTDHSDAFLKGLEQLGLTQSLLTEKATQ